jgi:integrase
MANKHSSKLHKKIFIFGKRSIEALPTPDPGKRAIYRDQVNQYLFLRVTPSAKTFFWQRTAKGKQHTVTISKFPAINADQARDRADEIAADYVKGTDVQAEIRADRQEMTLGQLWADYRVNRTRGQGVISAAHEYLYNRHYVHWKKKPLSEITYTKARKLILDIRSDAPVHANRVQRLGKALFNHGIKELRLKLENPFLFSQVSEKGRSRKSHRLHRADMPAFMTALDTLPGDNMKVLFLASLFTGRRIGEVKSMRWVDVDLQGAIWTIPDTKSGESQVCVMPKPLIDLLTDRKAESDKNNFWVFPAHSKSGHVEAINTAWEQVRYHGMTKKELTELKRLHKKVVSGKATPEQVLRETELRNKAKLQHLQARDLRGTLASWLQEAGLSMAGASQQLGHADISTTAKHYTTIKQSLQRIGVDAAAEAMLEAAEK